jgi:hypothetical protein
MNILTNNKYKGDKNLKINVIQLEKNNKVTNGVNTNWNKKDKMFISLFIEIIIGKAHK